MNRGSKNGLLQFPPMFRIDPETGKEILLPLNFGMNNPKTRSRSPKTTRASEVSKQPLQPLDLTAFMIPDDDEKPSKMRKIESAPNSSRRLFASNKSQKMPLYKKTFVSKIAPKKRESIPTSNSSPLLNMEEVEHELLRKKTSLRGYPFKSPVLIRTEFTKPTNSRQKSKKLEIPQIIIEETENHLTPTESNLMESEAGEPKTPDSSEEFEKLERIYRESPITRMCYLMQDTVINSAKRSKLNFTTNAQIIMDCIKTVETLKEDEKVRYEQNMSRLDSTILTLKQLLQTDSRDKENHSATCNRRSGRLQKKSPLTNNAKLLTSPAILRSDDLRKNTLKKNLTATNAGYQSPRLRKATQLYNSLRAQSAFLETPRSDRKNGVTTCHNLSSKIQTQCLLLQDTPVQKKHAT